MFGLKTISKVMVSGAMAITLVTGTAGSAFAASGSVGWHGLAQATCYSDKRLVIDLPNVAAAPVATNPQVVSVGGSFGGGTNAQWVGVRMWLVKQNPSNGVWYFTDQNRDGVYDHTAEFQVQTTTDGILWGADWWNADARRWIAPGDATLQAREPGRYILNTEYRWYTNGQVTGYDLLASKDHFVAQYFYVSKPYCTF